MRIMILAGAGASYAIDPNLYPTTKHYCERAHASLPGDVKDLYVAVTRALSLGSRAIDAEVLLSELADLERVTASVTENSLLSTLVAHNSTPQAGLGRQLGQSASEFVGKGQGFLQQSRALRQAVENLLFTFYAAPPPPDAMRGTWMPLIDGLRGLRPERLDIATTNYDGVIEAALGDDLPGWRMWRGSATMDLARWSAPADGEAVLLTKLHGSLRWHREGDRILTGSTHPLADRTKHAVIYPGFKGTTLESPYQEMHGYFAQALKSADVLVIIGFACRDALIVDAIKAAASSLKRIIIVDPNGQEICPLLGAATLWVEGGFGPESVPQIIHHAQRPLSQ